MAGINAGDEVGSPPLRPRELTQQRILETRIRILRSNPRRLHVR